MLVYNADSLSEHVATLVSNAVTGDATQRGYRTLGAGRAAIPAFKPLFIEAEYHQPPLSCIES